MTIDLTKPPQFIDTSINNIITETIDYFQNLSGRVLESAQVERLFIGTMAYREGRFRAAVQNACIQMLVPFSTAPVIDYLAALVGVTRLGPQAARTTITFTLVSGHGDVVIPAGTRVRTTDGKAIFAIPDDTPVDSLVNTIDIVCICEVLDITGNGYDAGLISVIMDPQPYLSSAANIDTSNGGSVEETDENLRKRIMLAPGSFSNAGSKDAYKYFASSAHPDIIDVEVAGRSDDITIPGGQVNIYPLTKALITTPTEILDLVFDACNEDKVRPLTDTVVVLSPTIINYTIDVGIVIYQDADSTAVSALASSELLSFGNERSKELGIDVILNQIKKRGLVEGGYDIVVNSPVSDIVVAYNEVAVCTDVVVNITGTNIG